MEAIVEAMKRDMKAANVQAFGAAALQSLATQNQDNVRRCHKLKARVQRALEAQSEVVDFLADAMEVRLLTSPMSMSKGSPVLAKAARVWGNASSRAPFEASMVSG